MDRLSYPNGDIVPFCGRLRSPTSSAFITSTNFKREPSDAK
jgi:hypothetical protein